MGCIRSSAKNVQTICVQASVVLISLSIAAGFRTDIGHSMTAGERSNVSSASITEKVNVIVTGDGKGEKCEIPNSAKGQGDPDRKLCCANEAVLYSCVHTTPDELEIFGEWYCWCSLCTTVEEHFNVLNWQVHKYYNDEAPMKWRLFGIGEAPHRAGELQSLTTTSDLDPKVSGPLYTTTPAGDSIFSPRHQYVLFIYPRGDHNGAFSFQSTLCERLSCWRQRGYAVVMRSVSTIAEASSLLDKFGRRSLDHVILGGHGSAKVLCWGSDCLEKGGWSTSDFLFKLRTKLKIDGTVTLDACSNGKERWYGLQNLFEYVASKLPGRRITASKISLTDSMWRKGLGEECLAGDSVLFEHNRTDVTAIARRGHPNCKELQAEDIEKLVATGGSCLSRCRATCPDAEAEWASDDRRDAGATLTHVKVWEGRYDPCTTGYKTVCKISPMSAT